MNTTYDLIKYADVEFKGFEVYEKGDARKKSEYYDCIQSFDSLETALNAFAECETQFTFNKNIGVTYITEYVVESFTYEDDIDDGKFEILEISNLKDAEFVQAEQYLNKLKGLSISENTIRILLKEYSLSDIMLADYDLNFIEDKYFIEIDGISYDILTGERLLVCDYCGGYCEELTNLNGEYFCNDCLSNRE